MEDLTTEKKYEKSRTKSGQKNPTSKRRVNITVTGSLWDKLDEMGIENKSSVIEDFLRKMVYENELKKMNRND